MRGIFNKKPFNFHYYFHSIDRKNNLQDKQTQDERKETKKRCSKFAILIENH